MGARSMRDGSRDGRARVRRAGGLLVAALTAAGALAGCAADADAGLDTTAEGQVAYACALVERVGDEYGAPEDWQSILGDAADPGAVATTAAAVLLGGMQGGSLEAHPELTDAAAGTIAAISRVDGAVLAEGVAAMQSGCADVEESASDATQDGQIAYACALAAGVQDEHGAVEAWGDGLESPAWRAAGAAAALVGAANGGAVPGSDDLAESARDVLRSATLLDDALMQAGIDDFAAACEAR